MRALLLTLVIVTAQYILINRFPDPKWVLLTLAIPPLLWVVSLGGLLVLVSGRRGGGRR